MIAPDDGKGDRGVDRPLVPRPERLRDIKLIGLGGVGSIVARYGAVFLAALDLPTRLVLVDGDDFEPQNATRMIFPHAGNKAAILADELAEHTADSRLDVHAIEEFVESANLPRLVREGDIVILAVDNHATRKLVSEYCVLLDDVCLISGGNDGAGEDSTGELQRGTYGNVQIFLRSSGTDLTPALTEFHPEIASPADKPPTEVDCTTALVSTPQILFANLAVASGILNALWLHLCDALHYPELCLDIHDGRMQPLPLPSRLRY